MEIETELFNLYFNYSQSILLRNSGLNQCCNIILKKKKKINILTLIYGICEFACIGSHLRSGNKRIFFNLNIVCINMY